MASQILPRLTFAQIESATGNFDESLVIGRGELGKVYRSRSMLGEVAIKRLFTSSQGEKEFETEVELLSRLCNENLVPLIGYCCEGEEKILVYEFMPNGSLEDQLHKGVTNLSWVQRLKICVGAARGLKYLHTATDHKLIAHAVIHGDVKTSNILLDSEFEAKISDFGLAKLGLINQEKSHESSIVKGTFRYLDPSYSRSRQFTTESDVYAFGVVLFEVLSGRQAIDGKVNKGQRSLVDWAQKLVKRGRFSEIVSHELIGQIPKKCLKEFANVANKCLVSQPEERPTMFKVLVKLESILSRENQRLANDIQIKIADGGFISKVGRYFKFFRSISDMQFFQSFQLLPARVQRSNSVGSGHSVKKFHMLAARHLEIAWANNPDYWRWIPVSESRSEDVAELLDVCWFDVSGRISTTMMSPNTVYVAFMVFKATSEIYGFNVPVDISFGIKEQESPKRIAFLDTEDVPPYHTTYNVPQKRADRWVEVEVGEYFVEEGEVSELVISVKEVERKWWKGGIVIKGIEIRPKPTRAFTPWTAKR